MEKEILQKLIEQNMILQEIKSSLEKLSSNIENLQTVKIIHENSRPHRNHSGGWAGNGNGGRAGGNDIIGN